MPSEDTDDLAFEAATNRRYLAALRRQAPSIEKPAVSTPANVQWVGQHPHAGQVVCGPLIGRIGLDQADDDVGIAFYIGARWLRDFDHPVVSWAAPVARIFFEPGAKCHELADRVVVRRTLLSRVDEIVRFYDSWEVGIAPGLSPFTTTRLHIPPAPPPMRQRGLRQAAPSRPQCATPPSDAEASPCDRTAASRTAVNVRATSNGATERLRSGMRSVEAVEYALRAPRSDALGSVLSTLQPDQYRLVTRPRHEPLVVQGHPGTGKTIIGIHRAAYLASDERKADRVKRVLFLGPSDEWVRHVSGVLRALDPENRVSARALPTWLAEIAEIKHQGAREPEASSEDVGRFVKGVLDRAAVLCREERPWATGAGARMKNLERLYTVVREGGTASARLRLGNLSTGWIKTLPTFREAIGLRRYLPLFAQAAISILGRAPHEGYGYIIVDEAQDVSGLEWEIIRAHNAADGWTLVGDMNQRMTDRGDSTWDQVIEKLGLRLAGGPVETCVIRRGYRSTQPILDFTKPLLTKTERDIASLQQDGPAPTVIRVTKRADRDQVAIGEADRLQAAYPHGTVAVITADIDHAGFEQMLLSSGWRRERHPGDWRQDARRLALRTPETARGVEFDAVVVVEPGAFPRNLGRSGPLYTSLTRANRELAVVHHAALPDDLRRHGRRGRDVR